MARKQKGKGSESYPTSMTGWDKGGDIAGVIKMTPEFLEELLDAYEDGDPLVVDDYDEGYIKIGFYLGESEYDSSDYLGSCKIMEPQKKSRKKSRQR